MFFGSLRYPLKTKMTLENPPFSIGKTSTHSFCGFSSNRHVRDFGVNRFEFFSGFLKTQPGRKLEFFFLPPPFSRGKGGDESREVSWA